MGKMTIAARIDERGVVTVHMEGDDNEIACDEIVKVLGAIMAAALTAADELDEAAQTGGSTRDAVVRDFAGRDGRARLIDCLQDPLRSESRANGEKVRR